MKTATFNDQIQNVTIVFVLFFCELENHPAGNCELTKCKGLFILITPRQINKMGQFQIKKINKQKQNKINK